MLSTFPADQPTLFRRAAPASADASVVAALTVFVVLTLPFLEQSSSANRAVGPLAYVLILVAAAATLIRRRWPFHALLVSSVAVATYLVLAFPYGPVFGFVVLTVYTVARQCPPRHAAPAGLATYLLLLAHLLTNESALPGVAGALPAAAWVAIPFTVGAARRMVVAAREREQAAVARQVADAERLRLSQEIHDVVGHGLAAIQMQADIALHVEQQRPEQARAALAVISRASGYALDDLRETLRRVHPGHVGGVSGEQVVSTPGLDRVEELCARVTEAGVQVELNVSGSAVPLSTGADVAAYRLLQESLTNVVKHSAHPGAVVTIVHTEDAVQLEVTNQDLGAGEFVPGIGITGMRRRVASVGGRLDVGPGKDPGVFTVRATIPREHRDIGERYAQEAQ